MEAHQSGALNASNRNAENPNAKPAPISAAKSQVAGLAEIDNATAPNFVLRRWNLGVTAEDIDRLSGNNKLNDAIVDFCMRTIFIRRSEADPSLGSNLLVLTSLIYKRYFVPRDWTRFSESEKGRDRVKALTQASYITLPVNDQSHWILAIIQHPSDLRLAEGIRTKIYIFNSLQSDVSHIVKCIRDMLMLIREQEYSISTKYKVPVKLATCPQQPNDFDCGVYALYYFNALTTTMKANMKIVDEDDGKLVGYAVFDERVAAGYRKILQSLVEQDLAVMRITTPPSSSLTAGNSMS